MNAKELFIRDEECQAFYTRLMTTFSQINDALFELLKNSNHIKRAQVLATATVYTIHITTMVLFYGKQNTQGWQYKEMTKEIEGKLKELKNNNKKP